MSDSEKKTGKIKIIPIIIGASSVCIAAVLVILFVVLGGKDKSGDIEQAEVTGTSASVSSEDEASTENSKTGSTAAKTDAETTGEAIETKPAKESETARETEDEAEETEEVSEEEQETEDETEDEADEESDTAEYTVPDLDDTGYVPPTVKPAETKPAEPVPVTLSGKLGYISAPGNLNPSVPDGISFAVSGDTACGYLPYVIDDSKLKKLKIIVDDDSAKVSFSGAGANADGTVNLLAGAVMTITDASGNAKSYNLTYKYGHDLPVVYINTQGGRGITSKYNYINATFSLKANGVAGFTDVASRGIRIRGRGNSTWIRYFPKKSFKMNFNEKISLMGASNDKDWLLIANFYDRSLSRNTLALELSRQLTNLQFTMDSHPVDVVLNGKYYGVYDLTEQPEVAKGRIAINTDPSAQDSGFYLEVGGAGFSVGSLEAVEIHYPKEYTNAQKKYIADYLKKVDSIITSGADLNQLSKYVDLDSLVDWLILQEYTYNFDAGFSRNTYMYKEPGGKLKFGPAWDFDLSMGSVFYNTLEYQNWATSCNGLNGVTWSTYLYENPYFIRKMRDRWLQVRGALQVTVEATLNNLLTIALPSFEENYNRWMKPYEGQNLLWECELEYKLRTMADFQGYVKKILNYRYKFLNRALMDGYKPKKEGKDGAAVNLPKFEYSEYTEPTSEKATTEKETTEKETTQEETTVIETIETETTIEDITETETMAEETCETETLPEETSEETPEETPEETSEETPEETPEQTPEGSVTTEDETDDPAADTAEDITEGQQDS